MGQILGSARPPDLTAVPTNSAGSAAEGAQFFEKLPTPTRPGRRPYKLYVPSQPAKGSRFPRRTSAGIKASPHYRRDHAQQIMSVLYAVDLYERVYIAGPRPEALRRASWARRTLDLSTSAVKCIPVLASGVCP